MRKIFLILIGILYGSSIALAWNDAITHPDISEQAAANHFGVGYLEEKVNGRRIREWVRQGAEREDAGTKAQFLLGTARSLNHFHAPNRPLSEAGLADLVSGISALSWAQAGLYQESKDWPDWSWQNVRHYQYSYLTASDDDSVAINLSDTLQGLGYQMHIIQDMSQPNHVRNDTHIIDGSGWSGFETWAANYPNQVRTVAHNRLIPILDLTKRLEDPEAASLVPVARLGDTRQYYSTLVPSDSLSQGLSEYTNANFFSEDTVFAFERFSPDSKHYFPYPRKSTTDMQAYLDNEISSETITSEDGKSVEGIWVKRTGADGATRLARAGALSRFWLDFLGEGPTFYGSFALDEVCYQDYLSKLIPRAVGYSEAMLKYFERGTIELTPISQKFNNIRLSARNTTKTGEEMTEAEEIKLVLKYKLLKEEAGLIVQDGDQYHYIVASPKNPVSTIPAEQPVDLEFDLSATPIPMWANDVTAQVVFKGKLGDETGAVAVSKMSLPGIGGGIDITPSDRGVYAIAAPGGSFTEVRLKAINALPGGEAMTDGKIDLVLLYQKSVEDPFQGEPTFEREPAAPAYYYVKHATAPTRDLSGELVFDLSANPLPLWATDVYAYIVYEGQVGTVSGTKVWGGADVAEPTPLDITNNMDYVCVKTDPDPGVTTGSYFVAGSQEAIDAVGANSFGKPNLDIYPHRLKDVYVGFNSTPASASNYSIRFPVLEPGQYGRVFVLPGYDFEFSSAVTVENIYGPMEDTWVTAFETFMYSLLGVPNQLFYENGEYVRYYPGMELERGLKTWWSLNYKNHEWPAGTTCNWSGTEPFYGGPATVQIQP